MRKKPVVIVLFGSSLLVILIALSGGTTSDAVQTPWLHRAIPPVLALTMLAAAWIAWRQPVGTVWKHAVWEVTYMVGGLTYLQGNNQIPFVRLLLWAAAVFAVLLGRRWYEQPVPKQTV